MAKQKLTPQQIQELKDQFDSSLVDFYYGDNGLGIAPPPHTNRMSAESVSARFYDENGTALISKDTLFNSLIEGKPVFAFKCGELMPHAINFENGKLAFGADLKNLGEKPKAPGFWNRFLSIFGVKSAKDACQKYDQYIKNEQYSKVFNADEKKASRKENAELESKNKRMAEAPEKHIEQKKAICNARKKEKDANTLEYFNSPNRWEHVGVETFMFEVSKMYRLAYPHIGEEDKMNLLNAKLTTETAKTATAMKMYDEGKAIIKNIIREGQYDIFDALVSKIVGGKITDQEEYLLDEFFTNSYGDKYFNRRDGVDYSKVANTTVVTEKYDGTFVNNAQEMFQRKDPNYGYELNDTKAMLAVVTHFITQANKERNVESEPIMRIGKVLTDYHKIHTNIAEQMNENSELELNENAFVTIGKVHLLQQAMIKQTKDGNNDLITIMKNDYLNTNLETGRGAINNTIMNGEKIVNGAIKKHYVNTTLKDKGFIVDKPIDKKQIAQFLDNKQNYKLVAKGLKEGLETSYQDYSIGSNFEMLKTDEKTGPEEVKPQVKAEEKPQAAMHM